MDKKATPPDNGCDDCAYYTAAFEEKTYCPECEEEEKE
jgi:anaerobic ribonucleoside-triphosphate reductase